MGMLLRQYHDQPDNTRKPGAEVKGPTRKGRKRGKRTEDRTEGQPPASPYADLSDEQVQEAYTTNVDADGDYPGRDAAVEALTALDAENE